MSTNPVLRDSETRGIVSSTQRYIVTAEQIKQLKDRLPYEWQEGKPEVLFTAIDPFGGGEGSKFAIITMALNGAEYVPVVRFHLHHPHTATHAYIHSSCFV